MMKLMALRRLVHERGFAHAEIAHGLVVFRYVAGKARMLVVIVFERRIGHQRKTPQQAVAAPVTHTIGIG
jgi:hypothetical protein